MMNSDLRNRFSPKQIGIAALLLMTIIWGGTFVVIKVSLNDISSMLFLGIRFFIAGMILLPFVYKRLRQTDTGDLLRGALLGLFLFIAFATQTIGLKYTTATKSSFITGTVVIIIPIFQVIMERKKPSKGTVIGTVLVLAGLMFLSAKDTPIINFFNELGSNFNKGDFYTFICALIFSVHIVYLDIISKNIDFMVLVFMQIAVTTVLAFIMSFVFSGTGIEPVMFRYTDSLIFGLLYTSILATILTTILQTKYQKEVSPAKAGIIYSFEPVFAGTFAVIILNEDLYIYGLIGAVLIFAGLLLSELMERKKRKPLLEYQEK